MQGTGLTGLHWQRGYGAFSIGYSQLPALLRYSVIEGSRFRRNTGELLQRYAVAFDERYVWN